MGYVVMIGQLIVSLSILIVLHELGHFTPAKLFKTKVEKFYLFFDPWFSLIKKKIGETEYGIGWLPLGGYVKIAGMVDESFDTEKLKEEPKPWEFRSKPAWQRLIIMLGGVTVNFILGFLIFGMVLFFWGREYIPADSVEGIYVDSLGREMGLQNGDQILTVGGKEFVEFDDRKLIREIVINSAKTVTVKRDGQQVEVPIDEKFVGILASAGSQNLSLFSAPFPCIVEQVQTGTPADKAGLQKGDQLIAFNGEPTPSFQAFRKKTIAHAGQAVDITALRGQDTVQMNVDIGENTLMGFAAKNIFEFYDTKKREYGFVEAIPAGFSSGWTFLTDQFKAFAQMFKGKIKASDSLGGFGTIGKMFGSEWDWQRFWRMTAILSLILAFMNLLPIPALDGGHVMFLLYEMVTGRKPSDKFVEIATMIGFIIIIGLVLYANGLDVIRGFFNK